MWQSHKTTPTEREREQQTASFGKWFLVNATCNLFFVLFPYTTWNVGQIASFMRPPTFYLFLLNETLYFLSIDETQFWEPSNSRWSHLLNSINAIYCRRNTLEFRVMKLFRFLTSEIKNSSDRRVENYFFGIKLILCIRIGEASVIKTEDLILLSK